MTRTPWGTPEALRRRQLRPGPGLDPGEVENSQRERLFAAMVQAVAEEGYRATTVARLIELAGVSRSTFYERFDDKEDCYLAAFQAIADRAVEPVAAAYDGPGTWPQRLVTAFTALADVLATEPAAARLCLVDVYSAGPRATALARDYVEDLADVLRSSLQESPAHAELPDPCLDGIVHGVRRVVYENLRDGREAELAAKADDLVDWALSYRAPSGGSLPRRPRYHRLRQGRRSDPASAPPTAPLASANGDDNAAAQEQRERILTAVSEVVAAEGYERLSTVRIVAIAGMSRRTFYRHFANSDEALLAAFDVGTQQLFATAAAAFHDGADWPDAIRRCVDCFAAYLASAPGYAKMGVIEASDPGLHGTEHVDALIEGFEKYFLTAGFEQHGKGVPAVAKAAIAGAVHGLVVQHIAERDAQSLPALVPYLTTLVLVPFIGPDAAHELALRPPEPVSLAGTTPQAQERPGPSASSAARARRGRR